jgi:hypothetical protein
VTGATLGAEASTLCELGERRDTGVHMRRLSAQLSIGLLAMAFQPSAHAALPGRVVSTDLLRLAAYGDGLIDAAGPGMAVAIGADGGAAFGGTGCDAAGFSYRTVVDPRATVEVDIPATATRMDVIVRPAHGLRELQVVIGGRTYADVGLHEGWQRVTLPLDATERGRQRVRLGLTGVTTPFKDSEGLGAEVRGLLHGLRFSTHAELPESASGGPLFTDRDILWLESGESISIPVALAEDQALETSTIVTRGEAGDLVVRVETVNEDGAAGLAAELPAALALPWNVDLSRAGIRTPSVLRIRVLGSGSGAVGLVNPTLTIKGTEAPAAAAPPRPNRLVVVAVRGLRAADVEGALPGTTRIDGAFATAPTVRSALASLLTGLYPVGHGVVGLQDRLSDGIPTLASLARAAGWRTALRLGTVPAPASDPIFAGFDDARGAGASTFPPHAEGVLGSLLEAIQKPSDQPLLALAVLGDGGAPWLPRGEHWKKHWRQGASPWPPADGRRAVEGFGDGSSMNTDQRTFASALRRGKADEVAEALGPFIEAVRALPGDTAIVIVGLGGGHLDKEEPFSPDMVAAPMWVAGGGLEAAADRGSFDLTDVAATLLSVAAVPLPSLLPGLDIRRQRSASSPKPAFAATATRTHLVVLGDAALVRNLRAPEGAFFSRTAALFNSVTDAPGQTVLVDRLERTLGGWLGAGAAWNVAEYSPSVARGDRAGYPTPCTSGR